MTTYTAGQWTEGESDGKSVYVTLSYTTPAKQVAVVEGFLGITNEAGVSGDVVALTQDRREYQFSVPASLSVSKGNIVYVTIATVTGHIPDDGAYSTSSGAGKLPLFKATSDKDSNNVVRGILLQPSA